jgi:hypothetical protein
MKRIVQLLVSALLFASPSTDAHPLTITAGLSAALGRAVEASRATANKSTFVRGVDFVISKIDAQMVEAFTTAWRRSVNGTTALEGVVLIQRMAAGGYYAKELGPSNEQRQFTFRWQPATIAIVHTHPNSSDPKPQNEDLAVADKYQVPIFTITSRGAYVYDPDTKKVSKLMDNLDWLQTSNWTRGQLAKQ